MNLLEHRKIFDLNEIEEIKLIKCINKIKKRCSNNNDRDIVLKMLC